MSIQAYHPRTTHKRFENTDNGKIVFGMYNTCTLSGPDGYLNNADTTANWVDIRDTYMDDARMKVRRSFHSNMPSNISQTNASTNAAAGVTSALSVKPTGQNPANVINGSDDASIASLAASMPAGSYLMCYHEPEENMSGATFVSMQQRFYDVAKAANSNIFIGPAHMGFKWWPSSAETATPDDWYVGDDYCDFLGIDVYTSDYRPPYSLRHHLGHQRWHEWAAAKGKPLAIMEYSVELNSQDASYLGNFSDSERAAMISDSLDWMASTGQYKLILFWNGYASDSGANNWQITPTASDATGSPLALAAWNAAVTAYGAANTSSILEIG